MNNIALEQLNLNDKPPVIIVIGMAGSGKTTLMQRINSYVHTKNMKPYIINLDPAVNYLPYEPNIDIRESINYAAVMEDYNLGPNGAILTSLNLFATRFDQVLELVGKRYQENAIDSVFIDTPGQIEIFTWSASGAVITEALATVYPTIVLYVIDTPRCNSPITFVSNMLYACGILYKTKLPFILAFNKSDIADPEFAINWMQDFDSLQDALEKDDSYMASLSRSMGLVLEEFYENLKACPVSAVTGEGMDELFESIQECKTEYYEQYKPEIERLLNKKRIGEEKRKDKMLQRIQNNMSKPGSEINKNKNVLAPPSSSHSSDYDSDYSQSSTDSETDQRDFYDGADRFDESNSDNSDEDEQSIRAQQLKDKSFQSFINSQH